MWCMLVTVLLVAVLAMDIKCRKRLQAPLNIEVLYVYEYLVQLHFNFCAPQTT